MTSFLWKMQIWNFLIMNVPQVGRPSRFDLVEPAGRFCQSMEKVIQHGIELPRIINSGSINVTFASSGVFN
jgi:hypothetical protein